jgi:hypothetical protein
MDRRKDEGRMDGWKGRMEGKESRVWEGSPRAISSLSFHSHGMCMFGVGAQICKGLSHLLARRCSPAAGRAAGSVYLGRYMRMEFMYPELITVFHLDSE